MILLKILIAIEAFIALLIPNPTVVLDTETTGLSPGSDELLQVSILSRRGRILFNRYIKPERVTEWPKAQKVNNISPLRVKFCPPISVYVPLLNALLSRTKW